MGASAHRRPSRTLGGRRWEQVPHHRTPSGGTPPARRSPSSYDAVAALEELLARLRRSCGASRVAVWVHETSTGGAVPFGRVRPGEPAGPVPAGAGVPLALERSPVLTAVIGERRTLHMRLDEAPAQLADEVSRYGVRSAHGEPLLLAGEV